MASQKQRQQHDTANKQTDNGMLQWRQAGAGYQGLMTLIGHQTAPRLDRGDDGGGTSNGVRPTKNTGRHRKTTTHVTPHLVGHGLQWKKPRLKQGYVGYQEAYSAAVPLTDWSR